MLRKNETHTSYFAPHKSSKGITLIALIITIIVMIILVAVTLLIALGDNGIITNAKRAAKETEKQGIYEKIVGSIVFSGDGSIDVKATYFAAKNILEAEDKPVTPISPSTESEITSNGSVTFEVKGDYGTYKYTITQNEILIEDSDDGAGEVSGDFKIDVEVVESKFAYTVTLNVKPIINEETFSEDEAAVYVAKTKPYLSGYEINGFEDWIASEAIVGYSLPETTTYKQVIDMLKTEDNPLSTHQDVFELFMTIDRKNYKTIQEYAVDIFLDVVQDKALIINGETITEGVTWDGTNATYSLDKSETADYEVELQLDDNIGRKTITIGTVTSNLDLVKEAFLGKSYTDVGAILTDIQNGVDNQTTQIDETKMKYLGSTNMEGYNDNQLVVEYEKEFYAIIMESNENYGVIIGNVDLLYKNEGYEGTVVKFDGDGTGETDWIVLHDNTEKDGTVEIISKNAMGNLTIGPSNTDIIAAAKDSNKDQKIDDTEILISVWNNSIAAINDYCNSLVTNSNAMSVRSVGSDPDNPYNRNKDNFLNINYPTRMGI